MDCEYKKPRRLFYRFTQFVSWILATFVFRRKFLRNEIKNARGPYVVIANHQAALDFVNLIGATKKMLTFVISAAFYHSLPLHWLLKRMGFIPKQQFQTTFGDMKKMKKVIEQGGSLVIYPAGLMTEDGVSTPIPSATYQFLQWMGADVYAARSTGAYFVTPKWAKGFRVGRTYLDIYRLFTKEELKAASLEEIREKAEKVLWFDAYDEQEERRIRYKKESNIEGIENVLYQCPHCKSEFSMRVRDHNTICCTACGFEEECDELGFLHNKKGIGQEIRHVSQWSRRIYEELRQHILEEPLYNLRSMTDFYMINFKKHRFEKVGRGEVMLSKGKFNLTGMIREEQIALEIPTDKLITLPFMPGKRIEVQHGKDIYRCVLDDGRLAMKFIHSVKAFYELNHMMSEHG